MSNSVEIPVGVELDIAVAEACGLSIPEFSTDLNAAWEAAEKFGLFGLWNGHGCSLVSDRRWHVVKYVEEGADLEVSAVASGDTTQEAICRAILALNGK